MTKQRKTRLDKGKRRKPETKPIRVPIYLIDKVKDFIKQLVSKHEKAN